MPEYYILIENRTYKVELVKKEGETLFEAKINDKTVEFKVEKSENSKISPLAINVVGKTYQIELEKIDRHAPFTLKVNDAFFKAKLREAVKRIVTLTPPVQIPTKAERRREVVAKDGAVVAPMAGKIISVKVMKGDTVKAGDVVCILEAMKMENEIIATKAGKIQKINVSEGTPVNDGDILVVIN